MAPPKSPLQPIIQWFQSPWPLFMSMALAGITALTTSVLWMHNELDPSPGEPSVSTPLNRSQEINP